MPMRDQRQAAGDAEPRQRPIPAAEVPRAHRRPGPAVGPGAQRRRQDVGDVEEDRADGGDRRVDRRVEREQDRGRRRRPRSRPPATAAAGRPTAPPPRTAGRRRGRRRTPSARPRSPWPARRGTGPRRSRAISATASGRGSTLVDDPEERPLALPRRPRRGSVPPAPRPTARPSRPAPRPAPSGRSRAGRSRAAPSVSSEACAEASKPVIV